MDMNQLLNDITKAEVSKKELKKQLDILNKEYEVECNELARLNDKNLQYTDELKKQEREKQAKNRLEKQRESKATLSELINQLGQNMRR